MRAEYKMIDGTTSSGGVRDGIVPGDTWSKPIKMLYDETKYDDEEGPLMSAPIRLRKYRCTGYETIAIMEEYE